MNYLGLLIARINRSWTGIEIEPNAKISDNIIISHGTGIVIGGTSIIGDDVIIRQNVTIGRKGTSKINSTNRIHPIIENNVSIGAGAVILGPITVGHNSVIGANAVIVKDVPPYAVVAGVPGKIIKYIDSN